MRAETDSVTPETLYAKTSDDVWIAYQTLGEGPVDLIVVFPWVSHLEVYWEQPRIAKMLRSFARDARKSGKSWRSRSPKRPRAN